MKLDALLNKKKPIAFDLMKKIVNHKEPRRNSTNLNEDLSDTVPLSLLKELLLTNSEEINAFATSIHELDLKEFETIGEIQRFKEDFILKIMYLYPHKDQIDIFKKIDWVSFDTRKHKIFEAISGEVLQHSLNLDTLFFTKEDCLKNHLDLRMFFDAIFYHNFQTKIYGNYELSESFDRLKMTLCKQFNIFSDEFVQTILNEKDKKYFQSYGKHYYKGVISFLLVQDVWKNS